MLKSAKHVFPTELTMKSRLYIIGRVLQLLEVPCGNSEGLVADASSLTEVISHSSVSTPGKSKSSSAAPFQTLRGI